MLPSSPGRRLPPALHPLRRAAPARIDTPRPGTTQTPGRFRRSGRPGPAPRDAASGNGTRPAPGDAIRAITTSNPPGLVVHVTGPLGIAADSNNVFKGIDSTLLFAAVAVVIVIRVQLVAIRAYRIRRA